MNPAKKYLLEVEAQYVSLCQKEKQLKQLKQILYTTGGINYSRERAQTSPPAHASFESKIEEIEDLEKALESERALFTTLVLEKTKQIQSLANEKKRDILFKRYIQRKPLWLVADEMRYSFNYIRRLHSEALSDFQKRWL